MNMLAKDQVLDALKDISPKLVAKFIDYHDKNPNVYNLFLSLAQEMRGRGRAKYSAWTIINKMRWDHDLTVVNSTFKISNDYIALYSRLVIALHPEFDGFFDTKEMKRKNYRQEEVYDTPAKETHIDR